MEIFILKFRRESKQGILAGIKDYDGDGKYDSLIKWKIYKRKEEVIQQGQEY